MAQQHSSESFIELVQKHFSSLRSERGALSAAIDEDPQGYQKWMESKPKSMSYVKTGLGSLTPGQRRAEVALPRLSELKPDDVVALSLSEVGALSALPPGSAKYYLAMEGVRLAIPGSNCYKVSTITAFAEKYRCRAARRLVMAVGHGGDVDAAARALVAAASLQNPKLFSSTSTSKSK